jgi:uncharacterized protein
MRIFIKILSLALGIITIQNMYAITATQALFEAVKAGNKQEAQQLIKQRADIQGRDKAGNTPLHWAVISQKPDLIALLLRAGSDSASKNNAGETPEELLKKSIKLSAAQKENLRKAFNDFADAKATLFRAIRGGDIKVVKQMMRQGPIKAFRDKEGNNALHIAVDAGNKAIVRLILPYNKSLAGKPNNNAETPIQRAIKRNQWDILELFSKAGFSSQPTV